MGNSMKKFKKLAVLAITIPTLLSSTNISFAIQNIHNANGPGSFSTIDRFFKINLSNTKYSLKNLRERYKHNYNIILSLNYIRSFITLYTKDDFKNAFNSEKVQKQMKEEARKLFKEIKTDDESEILKVAVNVILYILDINISGLDDKQQKDCWASIKYVVNKLDISKIQKRYVDLSKKDPLYQFLLRGKDTIGNRGKGIAVKLIEKLQEQLNSKEYKCKYNNGNYSFGEFVFKNAIEVCTRNGSLPNFNTYSSDKVYAPITSQEQEQYKFDTVFNSPIEQEKMETQNTLNPQEQLIYRIPLKQLYLDGQDNVLYSPTVPCDDTYGIITIQTALTATNIQDTYIVNSLRHDKNGYIYNENGYFTYSNGQLVQLPFHISLNQLSLCGQGSVLYNPTVPCDDTSGFIIIQTALTTTNIPNIYIVNSILHDENGYIYNENGYFTYNNPLLSTQQSETITQGQYYYDTVFNSPIEQENMETQNTLNPQEQYKFDTVDNSPFEIKEQYKQIAYDSQEKSPRPPESTKTGKTGRKRTREYIDCQNPKCGAKKRAQPTLKYTRVKDHKTLQTYHCKECKEYFTLDENGNVVTRKTRKYKDYKNVEKLLHNQ